jgi:head-tail adaptor
MWRDQVQEIVGVKINEWQGAKIIDLWAQHKGSNPSSDQEKEEAEKETKKETQPIYIREKKFRNLCNRAAYAVACRLEASISTRKSRSEIVAAIHAEWTRKSGNNTQARAGITELERKLEWLNSGIIESNPARYL